MWSIWNKQTDINGYSAEYFLSRNKHLQNEDVIYIKTVNDRITEVQGKKTLSTVYGIDYNLSDDEFIAEYIEVITPKEPGEGEITDSEALAILTGETE
jgi:hypothetical protein